MSSDTSAKNTALSTFLNKSLNDLKSKGLYNKFDSLQSSNGPIITINGTLEIHDILEETIAKFKRY